jgi:hypothetical protein
MTITMWRVTFNHHRPRIERVEVMEERTTRVLLANGLMEARIGPGFGYYTDEEGAKEALLDWAYQQRKAAKWHLDEAEALVKRINEYIGEQ